MGSLELTCFRDASGPCLEVVGDLECLVDADGRNAFAHILCGGPFAPCLDAVPKREPTDDERLLPAELAQKQREAAEASDEDEDEDDEGDY